jgi:cytochrome P450 / NADPH-cytochrome P450 reductase
MRAQFPKDAPVNAQQVFQCYLELSSPASRNKIKTLSLHCPDAKEKAILEEAADASYETDILPKRISIMDLITKYSSVKLPIATFLEISRPMRVLQYLSLHHPTSSEKTNVP